MLDTWIEILEGALSAEVAAGDVTVLSDRPNWISLRMACRLETVVHVTEFLRELLADLGPMEGEKLAMAFRELLLNAVEHGGRLDPTKTVDLSYVRTSRSIVCYIRDPGDGFSWENLEHSAVANTGDHLLRHLQVRAESGVRPGGFGLFIVKRVADELLYNAKGNEVIFIKYL
jgi:anti-sigma regulatory factor (Ser/Thr protein kinase)